MSCKVAYQTGLLVNISRAIADGDDDDVDDDGDYDMGDDGDDDGDDGDDGDVGSSYPNQRAAQEIWPRGPCQRKVTCQGLF